MNIGNLTVVERSQMKAIMDEQGLQITGCTDAECSVEFEKILSERRIVVGEVNSIGKSIIITARYINVESGASFFLANQESGSLDDVADTASVIAKDLARRIVSGNYSVNLGVSLRY